MRRSSADLLASATAGVLRLVRNVLGADVNPQEPLMEAGLDSLGMLLSSDKTYMIFLKISLQF